MSIIPPVPLILSKLKYHIKNRVPDDLEEQMRILTLLGPYYEFRINAEFNNALTREYTKYDDIGSYIGSQTVRWDCIDTALNMLVRTKKVLRELITDPGTLRLSLCHRLERSEENVPWSDLYLDEFPLNIRGIRDEKGNELAPPNLKRDETVSQKTE